MADLIPLNSDTETKPTPAMRRAIAAADVGDEQQGRDPTVNRLQERVADLLGKEAGLWLPGGTLCNFIAVKVHTRPADAIVADWMAHIIRAESAGVALSSGVLIEPIRTERGVFTADELHQALDRLATAPIPYGQPAGLVCVEQTHNFGGGSVWTLDELEAVSTLARARGIPVHMDGARLVNACAASGVPPAAYAGHADSVWIDFTKGLGAPIGAVLAGSRDFITEARRMKHVLGGAMRQAGIAAAACLYALDHHVERICQDHANARRLAAELAAIDGIRLATPAPETNMVFFDVAGLGLSAGEFVAAIANQGVRLGAVRGLVRAVTHLDIGPDEITRALAAVETVARHHRSR